MDTSLEDRCRAINDLAMAPPTSSALAKGKRKQQGRAQDSPNKRRDTGQATEAVSASSSKAIPPGSDIPQKPHKLQPVRHVINQVPHVMKVHKGDVFEVVDDSPEHRPPKRTADIQKQRSKDKTLQDAPVTMQSSPAARKRDEKRKSAQSDVAAEGHASAILNGRAGTKNKRGRPSKKTRTRKDRISRAPPATTAVQSAKPGQNTAYDKADKFKHRTSQQSSKMGQRKQIPHPDEPMDNSEDEQSKDSDIENLQSGQVEQQGYEKEDYKAGSDEGPQLEGQDQDVEIQQGLLDEEDTWARIVKASQSVNRFPILTRTIRDLHSAIKAATRAYDRLAGSNNLNEDANEQLQESIDTIEQQVKDLRQPNDRKKALKTIRDIYSGAIPAMVDLADRTLGFHAAKPKGLHGYEALQEVVDFLHVVVSLCAKARRWTVKPRTDSPVIRPTSSIILPYTRGMIEVFDRQLRVLRKEEKKRNNERITKEKEAQEVERCQSQSSTQARRPWHKREAHEFERSQSKSLAHAQGQANESLPDREKQGENSGQDQTEPPNRSSNRSGKSQFMRPAKHTGNPQWTLKMDIALINWLAKESTKSLPSNAPKQGHLAVC